MNAKSIVGLFLLCRLVLLISLPLEGLRGFGDYLHFYHMSGMGLPFVDVWVEFPPVFPYLSWLLNILAGGKEHVYDYLLALILTLTQAGSLWLFLRLLQSIRPSHPSEARGWVYFAVTLILPYGWWYFDPLAVLASLLGMVWLLEGKDFRAGMAFAAGTLTKLFPVLALPMIWRWLSWRRALLLTSLTLGITLLAYAVFIVISPDMTMASLRSQAAKGSWETVWALVDGNYHTGNFGPESERYDPSMASIARGNPARLPSWLTLLGFAGLGIWFFMKSRFNSPLSALAFWGLTWSIFLLWSPGYSPQWVLYLLPFILLVLHVRKAILFSLLLTLINILEWPVILSRGYNWGLWLTILVRTLLLVMLVAEFWNATKISQKSLEMN